MPRSATNRATGPQYGTAPAGAPMYTRCTRVPFQGGIYDVVHPIFDLNAVGYGKEPTMTMNPNPAGYFDVERQRRMQAMQPKFKLHGKGMMLKPVGIRIPAGVHGTPVGVRPAGDAFDTALDQIGGVASSTSSAATTGTSGTTGSTGSTSGWTSTPSSSSDSSNWDTALTVAGRVLGQGADAIGRIVDSNNATARAQLASDTQRYIADLQASTARTTDAATRAAQAQEITALQTLLLRLQNQQTSTQTTWIIAGIGAVALIGVMLFVTRARSNPTVRRGGHKRFISAAHLRRKKRRKHQSKHRSR